MLGNLPWVLSGGTNASREHEVEWLWLGNFIASFWVDNFVIAAQLTEFWTGVVVNLFSTDKRS